MSLDTLGIYLGISCWINTRYPFQFTSRYLADVLRHFSKSKFSQRWPQHEVLISVKATKRLENLNCVILGVTTMRGRLETIETTHALWCSQRLSKRGYLTFDAVAMVSAKLVPGTHGDNDASCSTLRWCCRTNHTSGVILGVTLWLCHILHTTSHDWPRLRNESPLLPPHK